MAIARAHNDDFYRALSEDDPEELYENAPCGYLSTLPDGTIVKVNATFLRWTGFTRQDLVGSRRFQALLGPGDRIFYETHFAPLLRMQGHVREIAVEIVGSDGRGLPVLVNSVLKTDESGEPLLARTVVFDARERRAYENELLAARTRAEASEARARALAETLQRSLLPPEPPQIPGLDIAAAYRPAGLGDEVGGDFYDVFDTGRGSWGVVLGDVCGKGAQAAALTALMRYTMRAAATAVTSPAEALGIVHEAMVRYDPDSFATAVFATVAPGNVVSLTVAAGGHPLPLLRRADGSMAAVGTPGMLLGMLPEYQATDVTAQLCAGDAVVLYTDGVIEARRGDEFFGEQRLREVIADRTRNDAHEIVHDVVAAAVDFQDGLTRDDIAVLVVGH